MARKSSLNQPIPENMDLQTATDRLTRRTPASLARFIASLAFDTGPVGEQVRTFILADDFPATTLSLRERIDALRLSSARNSRRQDAGKEVGQRLDYILDAIETLILPVSPESAFDLLVLTIERDGDAMEQCGDHHFSVETALKRATNLIATASKSLLADQLKATLERLIAEDRYGTREPLAALDIGTASR